MTWMPTYRRDAWGNGWGHTASPVCRRTRPPRQSDPPPRSFAASVGSGDEIRGDNVNELRGVDVNEI